MKLSLATKVFLGFMVLLMGVGLLAFFSIREIRHVGQDLLPINKIAQHVSQIETYGENRLRDLRSVLETDPTNEEVEERVVASQTLILRLDNAYFPDLVRRRVEDVRKLCGKQIAMEEHAGTKPVSFREIKRRVQRIGEIHEELNEITTTLIQVVKNNEPLGPTRDRLVRLDRKLQEEEQKVGQSISDAIDRSLRRAERRAVWRVIVMTILVLATGLALTFVTARSLAPIGRLVQYARAISRGDYQQKRQQLTRDDELSSLGEELELMAKDRQKREEELDRQADELERAYRRVEELKRYHESIVRSLRTAVVVTDRQLEVTSTNRAAETHWGLVSDKTLGHRVDQLPIGPPLVERVGSLKELVDHVDTVNVKAVPLGDLLADATLAPLQNESGDVLGLVVALEDVTDAVHTKEALIRSERLAAIGRMSAHVTHEIRNPLSSIGLNAELLEDLSKDDHSVDDAEEAKELCRSIIREVDRLTDITDEYLKFARLPRPELREENVGEMLRTIGSFVRRDCEAANVDLKVEVPEEIPTVSVDADQMRQAILNLVRNAKESMPEGGSIILGADLCDEGLSLIVKDDGGGIPEESLNRIFDPFFSTKKTGTGLGLALSQQIVAEHGAELRVTSSKSTGSEFRIVVPLRQLTEKPEVSRDTPPALEEDIPPTALNQ